MCLGQYFVPHKSVFRYKLGLCWREVLKISLTITKWQHRKYCVWQFFDWLISCGVISIGIFRWIEILTVHWMHVSYFQLLLFKHWNQTKTKWQCSQNLDLNLTCVLKTFLPKMAFLTYIYFAFFKNFSWNHHSFVQIF